MKLEYEAYVVYFDATHLDEYESRFVDRSTIYDDYESCKLKCDKFNETFHNVQYKNPFIPIKVKVCMKKI